MNDVILSIVVSGTLASIVSSVIAYSLGIKKEKRESIESEEASWQNLNDVMAARVKSLVELIEFQERKIIEQKCRLDSLEEAVNKNAVLLNETVVELAETKRELEATKEQLKITKEELQSTRDRLVKTEKERNHLRDTSSALEKRVMELEKYRCDHVSKEEK